MESRMFARTQKRLLLAAVAAAALCGAVDAQSCEEPTTEAECEAAALAAGHLLGGGGYPFSGAWSAAGCYTYASGTFEGMAFWSSGSMPLSGLQVRICALSPTCAGFDCSGEVNALAANPASITCAACTVDECCTEPPTTSAADPEDSRDCTEPPTTSTADLEVSRDCVGTWSQCDVDCSDKIFTVTTEQRGAGTCEACDGARLPCARGEGDCPLLVSDLIVAEQRGLTCDDLNGAEVPTEELCREFADSRASSIWGDEFVPPRNQVLASQTNGYVPSICYVDYIPPESNLNSGNTDIYRASWEGRPSRNSGNVPQCCRPNSRKYVVCAPLPDIDCVGLWSSCSADCNDSVYRVSIPQSGSGAACLHADGATRPCAAGEGACPPDVNCNGSWSACTPSCDRTWEQIQPPSGQGTVCPDLSEAPACQPGDDACPPNEDCEGSWSLCGADCANTTYMIHKPASGTGSACDFPHGATAPCVAGQGECPLDINCIGQWSICGSDCDNKTYTVDIEQSGQGASCPAAHGDTMWCNAGEGQCPPDIDCVGAWSHCAADCIGTKTFSVLVEQSGRGHSCDAAHGQTTTCAAGDGDCISRPGEECWVRDVANPPPTTCTDGGASPCEWCGGQDWVCCQSQPGFSDTDAFYSLATLHSDSQCLETTQSLGNLLELDDCAKQAVGAGCDHFMHSATTSHEDACQCCMGPESGHHSANWRIFGFVYTPDLHPNYAAGDSCFDARSFSSEKGHRCARRSNPSRPYFMAHDHDCLNANETLIAAFDARNGGTNTIARCAEACSRADDCVGFRFGEQGTFVLPATSDAQPTWGMVYHEEANGAHELKVSPEGGCELHNDECIQGLDYDGMWLENSGLNCWNQCNGIQGPCDWCGSGYCCRSGWHDISNGCDGIIGGAHGHQCVSPPAYAGRAPFTRTPERATLIRWRRFDMDPPPSPPPESPETPPAQDSIIGDAVDEDDGTARGSSTAATVGGVVGCCVCTCLALGLKIRSNRRRFSREREESAAKERTADEEAGAAKKQAIAEAHHKHHHEHHSPHHLEPKVASVPDADAGSNSMESTSVSPPPLPALPPEMTPPVPANPNVDAVRARVKSHHPHHAPPVPPRAGDQAGPSTTTSHHAKHDPKHPPAVPPRRSGTHADAPPVPHRP